MSETKSKLEALPPDLLSGDSAQIASAYLSEHWDELDGSSDESTSADKLGRAENLAWNPPILSFTLERHGGTVNGSSRGELHHWEVDVQTGRARIVKKGHRQLTPQDKRLNVQPFAKEIAELITGQRQDDRLRWMDEDTVAVNIAIVIPETNQETTIKRRRRFHLALQEALAPHGWKQIRKGTRITYTRAP